MGFVPYDMERATLDDKHKIRKMLEYLGMTHPAQQVEFMSALLDKPFNTSNMTRQDFYTLVTKIQNIQENRNKA
jgi:Ca2+-binding EF-hand superfamily protein